MTGRAALRASDADRDRVAERLRKAAGEGRLLTEELEQRLERAFSARTYGQLNAVLQDLPGRRLTTPSQAHPLGWVRSALVVSAALVVMVAVLFLLTGVFAGWMLWLALGWFFFGRHRRRIRGGRSARSLHARGWDPGRAGRSSA